MVASHDTMLDMFNLCNMEYFGGELLFPQFELLHSKNICGYFKYTKGGWFNHTLYDPVIMMTDYYDFTESQFRDIMCHEMIHYYLAYTGVDRKCHHGKKFKKMAEQLNLTYGLHITKRLDLSKYKKRKGGRIAFRAPQTKSSNNIRFFKEFNGFLIEFNSWGEYFHFLLGRLLGAVVGAGIIILILYLFYLYG